MAAEHDSSKLVTEKFDAGKKPSVFVSIPIGHAALPTAGSLRGTFSYLVINFLAFSPYTFFNTSSLNPNP